MSSELADELRDGTQPLPDDVSILNEGDEDNDEEEEQPQGDEEMGPLLDLPESQACRYALKLWRAQDRPMKRRKVRWRGAFLRRMGVPGVRVYRTNYDTAPDWSVWVSPASPSNPPISNLASRMCRRLADFIFSDPPLPDCQPSSDTEEDRSAAEFSTRVLENLGNDSPKKANRTARAALSRCCTYGSGFRHHYIDPMGGGHRAKEVLASKQATEVGDGVNDPILDPTTGLPDPNPVKRFVTPNGQLTDKESAADREWMPAINTDILTGHHVRFLPEACDGIWDADGVMLAQFTTVGELRKSFPDAMEKMSPADVRKMVKFRPEQYRDLLPYWMHEVPEGTRSESNEDQNADSQGVPDDAGCFVLRIYYTQGALYPHGCHFIMGGSQVVLDRDAWEAEDANGTMMKLDIPVDQWKGYDEGEEDPYGVSPMEKLGGMNEIREAQAGFLLEHLDRFMHRKVFLPSGSIVQPRAMQQITGTYVLVNQGGEPTFEQVPDFPNASMELYDRMTQEIQQELGLSEGAQGLDSPNITSGAHAQLTIEQMNKALTEIWENGQECMVRGWTIQLQLVRAFFDQPQRMLWLGDDNSWKAKEWDRTDVGSTKNVEMREGSFTMLTPGMKTSIAMQYVSMGVVDQKALRKIARSNMAPILAIEDDPALLRIGRQIEAWKAGPSEQLKSESKQFQAQMQANPQMANPPQPPPPQPGQPPAPPPPPPPVDPMQQACAQLFARLDADKEPNIAMVRHEEMRDTLLSADFAGFPDPWKAGFVVEYNDMRLRGGVFVLEEQRQMYEYQQEQQIKLREAPTTILKGVPPQYDAPPQGQQGEIGGPDPSQPQPQGQPAPQPQHPVPLPTGHGGLPLIPPGANPAHQIPGGPAQGAPKGLPTPGGDPSLHPGHPVDSGGK